MTKIQLSSSCILNVPLQIYHDPFTFIVNQKEFQTTRLISDLLSPKISQIHQIDPTIDKFIINTNSKGDFSTILQIVNFDEKTISESDIEFIIEVIEQLDNKTISITGQQLTEEINKSNAMINLLKHSRFPNFYRSFLHIVEL